MKRLLALLLIISVAFSAVTVEGAWDTASKYKYATENINIVPPLPTQSKGVDYWVFEISAYGSIKTMIPVNIETGEVYAGDDIIEGIKVHYLANFFSTNSDIEDFLDSTKTMALGKKNLFETKKLEYETDFEPAIPENIPLSAESAYKNALQNAMSSASSVMNKAVSLKNKLEKISSFSDVSDIQSGFSALFDDQKRFAGYLEDVYTTASDLRKEITETIEEHPDFQAVGAQAKQSLLYSTLISDKNQLELDIDSNENVINSFFAGINLNADQYLLRLQERVEEIIIPDEELEEFLTGKISEFSQEYITIAIDSVDEIDPQYSADITELNLKITEMQTLYSEQKYDDAKALIFAIEDKISFLKSKIGSWPPKCEGGQYHDGTRCKCPSGQTLIDGKCAIEQEPYEINWMLVGGLAVLIIALLLYRFKDKLFGGKKNEEELTEEPTFYAPFE